MTRFCLIRHGETQWNADGRVQGQLDIPLSEVGVGQARAVARALGGEKFDALYCSDLVRVRQTAQPLAEKLGLEVRLDPRLRERHYGVFQGMTYADAKEKIPEGYRRFREKDPDYDFESGESLSQFSERALACLSSLARENEGKSIVIFTHGGIVEMAYRHATGRGLSTPRDFEIPNCGINRLEVSGAWKAGRWADIDHLSVALDDLPD